MRKRRRAVAQQLTVVVPVLRARRMLKVAARILMITVIPMRTARPIPIPVAVAAIPAIVRVITQGTVPVMVTTMALVTVVVMAVQAAVLPVAKVNRAAPPVATVVAVITVVATMKGAIPLVLATAVVRPATIPSTLVTGVAAFRQRDNDSVRQSAGRFCLSTWDACRPGPVVGRA